MSLNDIKDKTFLITGGGSGLGALYAEAFLKDGAKSIAILDINKEVGKATAEKLNRLKDGSVTFIKCDVTNEDELTAAFNKVVHQFSRIDVIVNNAGILDDSPAVWRRASDVNWHGLVSLSMKGVKHMRKDEGGAGGTIINLSSTAGLLNIPFIPIYSGIKTAVLQFSICLAMDPFYQRTGIRVLVLCPGGTDTPLLSGLENKCYDPQTGADLLLYLPPAQTTENCVAACLALYKEGANGTVYLTMENRPPKDITEDVKYAFNIMAATLQ